MGDDSIINFLEGAFPPEKTVRRTLSIPQSSFANGKLSDEAIRKLTDCFEGDARMGVVYFRQLEDGTYEVRSYAPVERI
jgi:hypothetical protein